MMKLWIVVYVSGLVASAIGPMPADVSFEECQKLAAAKTEEGRKLKTVEYFATCEWRRLVPKLY